MDRTLRIKLPFYCTVIAFYPNLWKLHLHFQKILLRTVLQTIPLNPGHDKVVQVDRLPNKAEIFVKWFNVNFKINFKIIFIPDVTS